MAENKNIAAQVLEEIPGLHKAKSFWEKYSKPITIVSVLLIVIFGGWYYYSHYVMKPKQEKALEALLKAQEYFSVDTLVEKSLNGDGKVIGFLKIIKNYDGTPAANLANHYAGAIYLKKDDFKNAIKHLEKFEANGATQLEINNLKLLGDAYMKNNQKEKGAASYKKAGTLDPKDDKLSPDCLYYAARAYEELGNNQEAIKILLMLKDRFPNTPRGSNADKYLGKLGSYKDE